jgi:hypothetical protein
MSKKTNYPKKLKDKEILECKIKIKVIKEVTKDNQYTTSLKDKIYIAEIEKYGGFNIYFNAMNLKELFQKIKQELYIK